MIKKIGFAAAIALVTVSAMASNFRMADQVYVPAAGHIGTFVSDLFISNGSETDSVAVSVIASNGEQGTQQNFANIFTLAPRERRELPDFVGAAAPNGLGQSSFLGQLIFNGCKAGGNCDVTTCDGGPNSNGGVCSDFRNISVESRIYSAPAGSSNTTGQLFAGYPWYSYVTQDQSANDLHRVFITGIRATTQYRTNIGLVNASQFSSTTFRVKLFQGANQVGSDFTRTLNPLGTFQSNVTGMFPGISGTNYWVQVTQEGSTPTSDAAANGCATGCPGFFAYGSVLDNATTDATTLEPQYFKSLTDAQIGCIYPAPGTTASCKGAATVHRAVKHK